MLLSNVKIFPHAVCILSSSDQDYSFLDLILSKATAIRRFQKLLGQEDKSEADESKKNNNAACQILAQAEEKDHQNDAHGHQGAALEQEPSRLAQRREHRTLIKSLGLENQRSTGNDDQVEPNELIESLNGIELPPEKIGRNQVAQVVRKPKRQREERGVLQLVNLGSELSVSLKHTMGIALA